MVGFLLANPDWGLLSVDVDTELVLAWFGPSGLASIVFALLAIEELTVEPIGEAVGMVALTVLLSVVLHGITAGPAGRRYAHRDGPAEADIDGPRPPRGFLHHSSKD